MNYSINLNGRKLVDSKIEQSSECIQSLFTYDDGTILSFVQHADNIDVKCNKGLKANPDGTVDIL